MTDQQIDPRETHSWQPSGGWGGPFIEFSEPQKLEERYETCAVCGAVRARSYFAGNIYGAWRYNINGAEGMYLCETPHEHEFQALSEVVMEGYPNGVVMERCGCGAMRQPTKSGGYRWPSVEEMHRYLAALGG